MLQFCFQRKTNYDVCCLILLMEGRPGRTGESKTPMAIFKSQDVHKMYHRLNVQRVASFSGVKVEVVLCADVRSGNIIQKVLDDGNGNDSDVEGNGRRLPWRWPTFNLCLCLRLLVVVADEVTLWPQNNTSDACYCYLNSRFVKPLKYLVHVSK